MTMIRNIIMSSVVCMALSLSSAVAQEKFIPSPQDVEWAMQFKSVSGPGMAVEGDGWGGWRSGTDGVKYVGNNPRPEYTASDMDMASGSAVTKGLVPPIRPAMELHLRDGVVTLGGDGNYYLTGSSGDNIWAYAKGIELWKSADLVNWEYVGLIWDMDKEADEWVRNWRKHPKRAVRAVWAPEIHYIKNNYYICFSMCPNGIGLLKSSTGLPEGPYVNAFADSHEPIANAIDPTLFEDVDGSVYLIYGNASRVQKLKSDLSGFDGKSQPMVYDDADTVPSHHAAKCVRRGMKDIGHEGAVLFRRGNRYYLGAADDYEGRYSMCVAVSESLTGPYRMRHEAVPCGGGTGFFKDKDGNWWCSYFGNDTQSHFREKIGFVRVSFASDGRIYPSLDQPFVPENKRSKWQQKWTEIWKNRYDAEK